MVSRWLRVATAIGLPLLACQCVSGPNQPLNKPAVEPTGYAAGYPSVNRPNQGRSGDSSAVDAPRDDAMAVDGVMVGVTFSGGGTRAAAYGYGVLKELEATQITAQGRTSSVFDHIDLMSGVSGGSVLAGYIGLTGRTGLADFQDRFLYANAEESLNTSVGVDTLAAGFTGGVNGSSKLPRWLDDRLFAGATMRDLEHRRPAHVHIYASDLYNRHPFVFSRATFEAICSDFESYPVSHAVAASAAVPFIFSPIVLTSYSEQCKTQIPEWVDRAINNPQENEFLKSIARGFRRDRDPEQVRYIKLADGGLSDNIGVTGFIIEHSRQRTPYAPLTPQQAVRLSRALFVVVNGESAPTATWARTLEGPSGVDMVLASTDIAIHASVSANFEVFQRTFLDWREELVRWRCALSQERVQQLRGTLAGWNCRDVQFSLLQLSFDQLGPERHKQLSEVPIRFRLPREQVDLVVQAGRDVLRQNKGFQRFLTSAPVRHRPLPARTAEETR